MLAAILAGLALSFETYEKLMLALLLLMIGLVALNFPGSRFLGASALMLTAVALPLEFGALNSSFLLAAFICALWFFQTVVLRREFLHSSRVVNAALAFVTIALISFLAGQYPWFPVAGAPLMSQVAGLSLFLLSAGLFLAFGHQVRHLVHLRFLTWLFLAAGSLVCIADVFPALGIVSHWTKPETLGSLFWTWLVAVSFSQASLNQRLCLSARTLLLCLTALTFFRGLLLAGSWASGWLPPLVALGVILFFRLPRLTLCLTFLAFPAGLFLATKLWTSLMIDEQYSYMTRLEAWRVLWQIIQRSPLIGSGPANYYYYTQLFPILGWYVRFNSHNNYADLLTQTGFLGLFAFCWFAFEVFLMTWRLRSQVPAGFPKAYVIGALGGLVGTLVSGTLADWIIPFVYNIGIRGFRSSLLFWVFMGGVLALKRMTADHAKMEVLVPQYIPCQSSSG
jgi:O-Antigen ligase